MTKKERAKIFQWIYNIVGYFTENDLNKLVKANDANLLNEVKLVFDDLRDSIFIRPVVCSAFYEGPAVYEVLKPGNHQHFSLTCVCHMCRWRNKKCNTCPRMMKDNFELDFNPARELYYLKDGLPNQREVGIELDESGGD